MALELRPNITKVAEFMGTPEGTVAQLLAEGRLGGALVNTLRQKGVALTPSVKNSVQLLVRTMEPQEPGPTQASLPDSHTTSTIMFTDIVGSTSMIERLGDRKARELLSMHDDIITERAEAWGGSMVKSMGDGFLLTFRSARSGVACALDAQRALSDHNRRHHQTPIQVRMGLSIGEPIQEGKDLFGTAVNMSARISATASGGQILVCQTVHTLLANAGEFVFKPLGAFELKGLAGTHPLFEVVWKTS